MSRLDTEGHFLDKPSTLWLTIGATVVSFAVALSVLQGKVSANDEKISDLKATYVSIDNKLDNLTNKINESAINQAQIKTDIEYIKRAIIVVQDKKE